jgi:hypothetical protein
MKEIRQELTKEYCIKNPETEEEFAKGLIEQI